MEDICTLLGSDGGDNLKLIFKILKRGEKLDLSQPNLKEIDIVDIGLRYDLTVPLVRMFSNNQAKLPLPFKSIQIGDSFRADRPQRGRLRQFIQCDIDIIGDPTVNAEIDILNTTAKTYLALGFSGFEIKINDRRILSEIISQIGFEKEKEEDICISLDKYDKIGIDGIKAELVEKGYNGVLVVELMQTISKIVSGGIESLAKVGVSKPVIDSLSKIINTVKELSKGQFDIKFDVSIIRGQGYYTGTVYELYIKNFSGACGGGGRYDNMIEKMTGKNIPAVGYSIGFEPTCMLLVENNMIKIKNNTTAVVYKEEDDFLKVLQLVESLNQTGNASAVPARKNLNFQLESLKQNGFTHYVLFEKGEVKPLS
jgi:histidyl-tRNA synthetase